MKTIQFSLLLCTQLFLMTSIHAKTTLFNPPLFKPALFKNYLPKSTLSGNALFQSTQQASPFEQAITPFVEKVHKATTISEYQTLANDFGRVTNAYPNEWLGYYYAAYCNTRIAWAYQQNTDKIEPFARLAETQVQKAASLAGSDTKALSEIYCVWSMIDRAYVFISPMSNGRKYGPPANEYIEKAKKANPDNGRALYLDGWVKYNTPKLWGGDKEKAKELFQQALNKLKDNPASSTFPHWGKSDCETLLSQYK